MATSQQMATGEDIGGLVRLAMGKAVSRCLIVVADIGVADALGNQPETAAVLAEKVGANADALGRIMRFLAISGVFEDQGNGSFSHTRMSSLLRTDHPAVRIDYIFLSESLAPALTAAQIWQEPPGQEASDHRPMLADFDLNFLAKSPV